MRALLLLAACTPAPPAPTVDTGVLPEIPPPDEAAEAARDAPDPRAPTLRVRLDLPRPCVDPTARDRLGPLEPPRDTDPWARLPLEADPRGLFLGGGVSVADLDGDGTNELIAARRDGVYAGRDDGGTIPLPRSSRATAAIPGDADGDGDLDLVVVRYGEPVQLFRQDEGAWVDATAGSGLVTPADYRAAVASWADADGDGDLDLFVGAHGGLDGTDGDPSPGSRLFEARGDGTFVDRSDVLPDRVREAHAFVAAWHDLDRDGLRDLYVVTDFGAHRPSQLLWGRGAFAFEPDSNASGLDVRLHGMGLGVGDLDGDDDLDVVVPGWGTHAMLLRDGRRWFEAHELLGLVNDPSRGQVIGWANELGDLDHDGDLDVIVGYGGIKNHRPPLEEPDEIYANDGRGRLTPVGADWGFDHLGATRAVLVVDLDGDGWLDLVRGDTYGQPTVHRARCGEAAWSIVRLEQPGPNRSAVGAEVWARLGDRWLWRAIGPGWSSVLGAGPAEAHFGLADADAVTVRVRWPDGREDVVPGLPTRRIVTLVRSDP